MLWFEAEEDGGGQRGQRRAKAGVGEKGKKEGFIEIYPNRILNRPRLPRSSSAYGPHRRTTPVGARPTPSRAVSC